MSKELLEEVKLIKSQIMKLETMLSVKSIKKSSSDETLDLIEACLNKEDHDFLYSLKDSYKKYGKLTDKQYSALEKFAKRLGVL